ncbi:hypothetical protein D3C85_198300 [compost metagenome]
MHVGNVSKVDSGETTSQELDEATVGFVLFCRNAGVDLEQLHDLVLRQALRVNRGFAFGVDRSLGSKDLLQFEQCLQFVTVSLGFDPVLNHAHPCQRRQLIFVATIDVSTYSDRTTDNCCCGKHRGRDQTSSPEQSTHGHTTSEACCHPSQWVGQNATCTAKCTPAQTACGLSAPPADFTSRLGQPSPAFQAPFQDLASSAHLV